MDGAFLAMLPAEVRQQVAEIEALTHAPVVVRVRNDGDPVFYEAGLTIVDMIEGATTTHILYPEAGITQAVLIHEIQHIYRNAVLAIEQLVPRDPTSRGQSNLANGIENDVEHLFIIPYELQHAPEGRAYWEALYRERVTNVLAGVPIQDRKGVEAQALRNNLLQHYLVTSLTIPGWEGQAALDAALGAVGLWRDSRNLVATVNRVMPNKALCLRKGIAFVQLNPESFRLMKFDVANGRLIYPDMPI